MLVIEILLALSATLNLALLYEVIFWQGAANRALDGWRRTIEATEEAVAIARQLLKERKTNA